MFTIRCQQFSNPPLSLWYEKKTQVFSRIDSIFTHCAETQLYVQKFSIWWKTFQSSFTCFFKRFKYTIRWLFFDIVFLDTIWTFSSVCTPSFSLFLACVLIMIQFIGWLTSSVWVQKRWPEFIIMTMCVKSARVN